MHVTKPIGAEAAGCCRCHNKAKIICVCREAKAKYCCACLAAHIEAEKHTSHIIEAFLEASDVPPEIQQLRDRVKVVSYLQEKLQKNITYVEDFEESIETEAGCIGASIEHYFTEMEMQVNRSEYALNRIMQELDVCKWNNEISETSIMEKYNLQINTKGKTLKLVDAEIDMELAMTSLRNFAGINLRGDVLKPDSRLHFFKTRAKELCTIELSSANASKKKFPNNFLGKDSAPWCELPNKQLFYCGGAQGATFFSESYIIDPSRFSIVKISDMNQSRALPAVIYYNGCVYVFGGYSGKNLSSCEKYDFVAEKWMRLAEMPISRSAFSVVLYNNCFYMTGDNKNLDKYNPANNTFETFNDILPESSPYSTLACVEKNLYLFQNSNCWEINLDTLMVKQSTTIPKGKWWSYFPPHHFENDIYFSRYDDSYIWSYNTSTKHLSKRFKL